MSPYAELLARLLPPVAYERTGARIAAELEAEGGALAAAQVRVEALLREIDPRTCQETLPDWERVYGLPDSCTPAAQSVQERRAALLAKIQAGGGLSHAYFIGLAAALGYTVTIDEFEPFRVETGRAEAHLFSDAWMFVWRVNSALHTVRDFHVETSHVEERLSTWGNAMLECVINRLKPAHTLALFGYT